MMPQNHENIGAEFERFYEEHFARVYNFVYYHVSDIHAADDLTAEVFCRAYRNFSRYDSQKAQPYTWLCAIARNAVTDHHRRMAGTRSKVVSLCDWAERESDEPGPEDASIQREQIDRLLNLVRTLSAQEQELVLHKYVLGMTNRDIAAQTGLSESNVGTKLSRVIAQLRKKWQDDEMPSDETRNG